MKINYASPYSVKPIDFGIAYLIKKKTIVTELLLEFGGHSLNYYIVHPELTIEKIYEILLQITEGLKYMELFKIEHNDIKACNILLDFIMGMPVIKFIDFDAAKKQSFTDLRSTQKGIPGYTGVYMAQELFQAKVKRIINSSLYRPFKCQVYSLGILILHLFHFLPFQERMNEFDQLYKGSIKDYNSFLDRFRNYSMSRYDPLTQRILRIVEICL